MEATIGQGSRRGEEEALAQQLAQAAWQGRQIPPFSRERGLSREAAYRIAAGLREALGGRVIGRKIGFTNRTIWERYGVNAPMWGTMTDSSVHRLERVARGFPLGLLQEPRLEPEVALRLATAPHAGMDEEALSSCVEWLAPAFEVVHSLFPGWRFALEDSMAAGGLHGALLLGPPVPAGSWARELPALNLHLARGGEVLEIGSGENVLGGPLSALRHLVETLEAGGHPPLEAGEIVTTGTLTDAWPLHQDEVWTARYEGVPLEDITVRFV